MKKRTLATLSLAALCLSGCTSHLIFVEEDHFGLKAQFEPNNPSPAELSLGYRRGVVAVIPQQSKRPVRLTNSVTVTTEKEATATATNTIVKVFNDPNELMSLYTVFRANVGFNNPVEVHHFLATGAAATSLLANESDLRNVTTNLNGFNHNQ